MSHAGRLLVATPLIGDPNFERTVVLLLGHGPDGAFGVVVNRPSDTLVREVLPGWAGHAAAPGVLFVGGPVGREAVLGLARTTNQGAAGFDRVVGCCGTVDLHASPDDAPGVAWDGVRLFAGSAGWGAGQLEDEIAEGAWWTVDASDADAFTPDPDRLWHDVLRRQPGELAWYANHPVDPSAN